MNLAELAAAVENQFGEGWRSLVERYFAVDPDGHVSYTGYQQRPAAERSVKHTGKGLYDRRNREFIVLPDTAQWLKRAHEDKRHREEQLRELDARIASVTHCGLDAAVSS